MKIQVESTTKIVQLNGVPARIWEGKTAAGVPVHCYVTRIATVEDYADFERELQEHQPPSPEIAAIDAWLIL